MLMSRHARPGHRPRVSTMRKDNAITQLVINYAPSYSPVKSTDITCVVCDHRFYIVRDLRITNRTPLLMRCGHAICTSCHCTNPPRPCPICDEQSINLEFKTQLPYNNYVIGLLNVIHTFQSKFDEPDITFHVPLKQVPRLKYDQGACKECGMIANYKCKNCDVIFCSPCFKKFHNKALQDHEAISLNKNAVEFEITNICNNPKHDNAFNDYYCEDCDFEGCSNCILQKHKDHKTVLQEERNENLMSEFYEAVDKLQETRIRIQNTQKVRVI